MVRNEIKQRATGFNINKSTEGESIETKVERLLDNGEPITDGAPLMYTERKEGVMAAYDIRTDRFDVAIEAMDKAHKSDIAKRENTLKNEGKVDIVETTQDTEINQ